MLQNSNILESAEVFFREPTKSHYLIEISKKSKLAHTSVKKNLKKLKELGLIKKQVEKRGKRNFPYYKANLDNYYYKIFKKIYNILSLHNSGLIRYVVDQIMPRNIILFGSYSRGEDTESSDIDLFIETKNQKINLIKFEKLLNRKIQIHFKEHFINYPNELKNNIINGVILHGYLEVF